MADQVAAEITWANYHEPLAGYRLLDLIRAVVRDEIQQPDERARVAQQAATQAYWGSDDFKAQVDALREGRPVVTSPGVSRCEHCGYRTVLHGQCTWCGKPPTT